MVVVQLFLSGDKVTLSNKLGFTECLFHGNFLDFLR